MLPASLGRNPEDVLSARYSSGSSGSAPRARCASSSACLASNASEMYFRKIKPRTTCLYSAASMLLRRASEAAQSLGSRLESMLASFVCDPLGMFAYT